MKKITIRHGYELRTIVNDIYNETDFFYSEYCQTAQCIDEIVCESDKFCKRDDENSRYYGFEEDRYMSEQQYLRGYPNNVIAFCGRRGHGKTSAMLSMTNALRHLPVNRNHGKEVDFWNKAHRNLLEKGGKSEPDSQGICAGSISYFIMDPIDPSTMEENDTILINILSRLYHIWYEEYKKRKSEGKKMAFEVAEAFQAAYRNVYSLKKPLFNEEIDEYDDLTRLAEAGDSFYTKQSVSKLVQVFLQYMEKDILVIQVDDADLNTSRSYEIVEDVRKYCVGPRIIVMFAVHLGTLRNCLEQENVRRYQYLLTNSLDIPHMERSKCREMAERYIDKLIPVNHQIHLPYVDEWFRSEKTEVNLSYLIPYKNSGRRNDFIDLLDYGADLSENYQHRLFRLIYEKTGVILMPQRDYLHNFLPRRYRDLTHFLAYFSSMEDIEVSGEGSIQTLLDTYYARGKDRVTGDKFEHRRFLLERRKENLDKLLVYFMQHWCTFMLEKEQVAIMEELAGVPLGLKCKKTIDLLQTYYNRTNDRKRTFAYSTNTFFPDSSKQVTYAQVMEVLSKLKKELDAANKYEFIYAIQMYYTICLNQSLCVHIEKADGFEEIFRIIQGEVFPQNSFYHNHGREEDFINVSFLREMFQEVDESVARMGWNYVFLPIQFRYENKVTNYKNDLKSDRNIVYSNELISYPEMELFIRRRKVEGSSGEWMINPEIQWVCPDINRILVKVISNEWVLSYCLKEVQSGKENVYDRVGFVLQLICNYDLQYRISKYVFYDNRGQIQNIFNRIWDLCEKIDQILKYGEQEKQVGEEVKLCPMHELPIKIKMMDVINDLFGNNNISDSLISSVICAAPKNSVFMFYNVVEKMNAYILRGDKEMWDSEMEDLIENCYTIRNENVYKYDMKNLTKIPAFHSFIETCENFLSKLLDKKDCTKSDYDSVKSACSKYLSIRDKAKQMSGILDAGQLMEILQKEDFIGEVEKYFTEKNESGAASANGAKNA